MPFREKNLQLPRILIAKHFIRVFVPLVLILLAVALPVLKSLEANRKAAIFEQEQGHLAMADYLVRKEFFENFADIGILAQLPSLIDYIEQTSPENLAKASQAFTTFAEQYGRYDQVRYLDSSGRETIRINYKDGQALVVPAPSLQNKAHRPYFQESSRLAPGERYVSPMDLNIENGQVEQPHKPMIRFGMAVFDRNGQRQGVVVLNYLGNQVRDYFRKLMPESPSDHSMLLNNDGYWLIGEQLEDEWGFMFGRKQANFAYRYPQVWRLMSQQQEGRLETEQGLFLFKTVYPVRDGQLQPYLEANIDANNKRPDDDYIWRIVRFIPKQALYADTFLNTKFGWFWIVIFLVLSALTSWVTAYLSLVIRKERDFGCMIIDSLPAHLAVLDHSGRVVMVNKAWYDFANDNGMNHSNAGLGENYLYVTRDSRGQDAEEAPEVNKNLQAMLAGQKSAFMLEYPCHAPDKQRWFQMQATALCLEDRSMIVVVHMDITDRKVAEIKLNQEIAATQRANRALAITQMALDKTEIGEFWVDVHTGRIQRVNKHACTYLGFSEAELLTMCVPDIDPEHNIDRFLSEVELVRKQGWDRFETVHQTKDGRIIPVEINLMYVADDHDTENEFLVGFSMDISTRKEAEAKLINTINENKLLLDTLNQQLLYSVADVNGVIVDVNDYFCRITGYSKQEIIGKSHKVFNSGFHDEAFWKEMWGTIKSGKAWRGDICNQSRDGSLFWVDTVIAPFVNAKGQIESYVSLRADITQKKETARVLEEANQAAQEQVHLLQALNQAQTWYRFVIESSDDAIIGKDLDSRIKSWNPGAEKMFGYSVEEAISHSTRMLIPQDKMNEDYEFMELVKRGESIHHYETQRLHKSGKLIEVSVSLAPIFDVSGDLIGASKIVRDITEHKQLEKSLLAAKHSAEAANQAKSAFLSTMSHEIRTPLNAIIGMVYLLERSSLSKDQKEQVDAIQISSRNLLALINDILDLSKIEAGELTLENHPMSLGALVDEMRTMFAILAEPKGLSLEMPAPSQEIPAVVEGDETRLRQMLINLINNAIKFTAQGTVSVNIALIDKDEDSERVTLRFTVNDTGIGIAPEAIDKLFKPFTQVDPSTTRKFGGTGLGLSIVRQLAEKMGGRVGVDSTLGQGSAFWFELPMKISSDRVQDLDYVAARPLHVLIAEDDKVQRQALKTMAEQFGWIVDAVESGQEVIDKVLEHDAQRIPYDCIILDWRMPRLDGLAALALLKSNMDEARIPAVIMATAYDQDALRQEAGNNQPDSILTKPVDSSILFNAVNKAVASHGLGSDHVLNGSLIQGEHHRWLPGVRVLVVDDSRMNLEVCRRILENEGALVTVSESGQRALDMLKDDRNAFDVILMDIQMPLMDGCEATHRIRTELDLPEMPIVALTAGAMASERERAMAAGMDDFLTKPLDPPRLVRVLRRNIEQKHAKSLPIESRGIDNLDVQTGWPEIAGIDSARACSNMEGDVEFFTEIMRMFIDEHTLTAQTVTELLNSGQRKQAGDLVHRLKGSVGNIGAMQLVQSAEALESAIRENVTDLANLLFDFSAAHEALIVAANAWLDSQLSPAETNPTTTSAEWDKKHMQALLTELEAMLSANKFEAGKLSNDIENLLENSHLAQPYQKVATAIARLQYQEALTALRDFQSNLSTEEVK